MLVESSDSEERIPTSSKQIPKVSDTQVTTVSDAQPPAVTNAPIPAVDNSQILVSTGIINTFITKRNAN